MTAYLYKLYSPQNIIVYGESLGAPIAVFVARRYSIPTLILDSPLPSIKIFIKSKYPALSFISFIFSEFDTEFYLTGYKGRTLMFHSKNDDIIPFESTINLQKIVTKFIPITGTHNNPDIPWNEIKNFIE